MDQTILALIAFTATSALTPGPNNIMLMTSGVNFGFRRTLPHILGVIFGFPAMIAIIGIGLGATVLTLPAVHDAVTIVGIVYMLWLAWHIASADPHDRTLDEAAEGQGAARRVVRPMSFLGATAFQWVNAKAWVSAIGMLAIYAPQGYGVFGGIAIVVAINIVMSVVSTTTWTAFGLAMARWLHNPGRERAFNWTMALLLVATLIPAVIELGEKYLSQMH